MADTTTSDEIRLSKQAYLNGGLNHAKSLGVPEAQAVEMVKKASTYRAELYSPPVQERLSKRASELKELILEGARDKV